MRERRKGQKFFVYPKLQASLSVQTMPRTRNNRGGGDKTVLWLKGVKGRSELKVGTPPHDAVHKPECTPATSIWHDYPDPPRQAGGNIALEK